LSEVDVAGLADRAKLDALKDLGPLVWAAQAQMSRLVGAAHETGASNADGYLGTAGWLRASCGSVTGPPRCGALGR
jgi:hypothetical protein